MTTLSDQVRFLVEEGNVTSGQDAEFLRQTQVAAGRVSPVCIHCSSLHCSFKVNALIYIFISILSGQHLKQRTTAFVSNRCICLLYFYLAEKLCGPFYVVIFHAHLMCYFNTHN